MSTGSLPDDGLRKRLAALDPDQRAALERKLMQRRPDDAAPQAAPDADRYRPFPMTGVQQAYWIGRSADFAFGGVSTYSYFEIDAEGLDLDRLCDAWNRLVSRHDMLRAVLLPDGTQQVLETVPRHAIDAEDLRSLSAVELDDRLIAKRRRLSHQLLAADRWPIFDIRASLLDGGRIRLHLGFDAMVADMASRRLLLREWRALYLGTDLPELTARFRDFAVSQQAASASPQYARARDYWLARIDTLPPPPELPIQEAYDRHVPPAFVRRSRRFDTAQRQALEQRAQAMGVSLNILLLLAYADTLRLWCRSETFTLNLTLFNRPAEAAGVVGDFTSLSMVQIDAPGTDSLMARAKRLQQSLWSDLDNRAFGGVDVVREILRRGRGAQPVMPVVFTSALTKGEVDGAWLGAEVFSVSQTPQVWIDLMVVDEGNGLAVHWNSVEALFPPGLMKDMAAAYGRLLGWLIEKRGDDSWPAIAKLLLPQQDKAIQDAANDTAGPLPTRLLHEAFKDRASGSPTAPAVITSSRTFSYGEIVNIAGNLGRLLREKNVRPNGLVAVVMHKGWEQIVAVLAVLDAGGAYLPIDPDVPPRRLQYMLADADIAIALTQPTLMDSLAWPDGVERIPVAADGRLEQAAAPLQPVQSSGDLAYVIYTSGSEGQPKGVAINHRGAWNTIDDINQRFAVGAGDRILALSSLSFDLSVYDIFGVLAAGGAIVVPDPSGLRDPSHWAQLLRRHGVTLWNSVPALMELLAEHAQLQGANYPALRLALLSGDRIAPVLPSAVRALAPGCQIACLGGATEASIWSVAYIADDRNSGPIPYGKPLRNQICRVRSSSGAACPVWTPGDLYIGGIGLAREYWNDGVRTKASFVTGDDGVRLYRTGDRARYLPDGNLEFLGREDNQVKLRGFRVELGEIETILTMHPAVKSAAVVVGAGAEGRLIAYVATQIAAEDVVSHLRQHLPDYMVPAHIECLAELPLTANGKVDRARLASKPVPLPMPVTESAVDGPLADKVARAVRQACRTEIPTPDTSLIDMGLTSIDLIRIVNAVEAQCGVRPGIEDFYRTPTIRWLTGQVANAVHEAPPVTRETARSDIEEMPVALRAAVRSSELDSLLARRRSIRRFTLRPVDPGDLSNLLAVLSQHGEHHAYGSASTLYPVQVYLFVRPGRVAGLAAGVYRYDPRSHKLLYRGKQRFTRTAFGAGGAAVFDEAAFALFLAADWTVIEPRYGARALHLATLEAGLITQTLELAAPICGLGLCQAGYTDAEMAQTVLRLHDRKTLLHTLLGGYPDVEGPAAADEEDRMMRMLERVRQLDDADARALMAGLK